MLSHVLPLLSDVSVPFILLLLSHMYVVHTLWVNQSIIQFKEGATGDASMAVPLWLPALACNRPPPAKIAEVYGSHSPHILA